VLALTWFNLSLQISRDPFRSIKHDPFLAGDVVDLFIPARLPQLALAQQMDITFANLRFGQQIVELRKGAGFNHGLWHCERSAGHQATSP
jgi:hypothetical protein